MTDHSRLLDDFMTRAELAAELNRSEITLFRWARKRVGPPVSMIGKVPMYRRSSVRQWLASLEQEPARAPVFQDQAG